MYISKGLKTSTQTNTSKLILTAVLFTIAKRWKWLKMSTKRWMDKLRYTHTMEYYIAISGLVSKSCLTLATPWAVACQAPLSMGFSRQEYWSGLPFPSPRDLLNPGIKSRSPVFRQILYRLSYKGSHITIRRNEVLMDMRHNTHEV